MKKIFHMHSCNTCQRIIKEWSPSSDVVLRDIKTTGLSEEELKEMHHLAGSYEALFSKRAKLYKEYGLGIQELSEEDYKKYLLEHYTFLKRPVAIIDQEIFVGNAKKVVASAVGKF